MSEITEKIIENDTPRFPQTEPCPIDRILDGLISAHGLGNYISSVEREDAPAGAILLLCMPDVLIFHPSMLYDVLNCNIPARAVSTHLSRLHKRGLIKIASIPSDREIQSVYYLTKAGHEQAASMIGNCKPFKAKTGQRLSETAKHDYGVSCGYLSLVRSPFVLEPTYEVSNMFEKSAMPSGKFMRRSLRPDALIKITSDKTFGTIYLEHDTGSEHSVRMIDKLNLYYDHGIINSGHNGQGEDSKLYEQNCIIYTFRKGSISKPACFSYRQLQRLIDSMSDDQLVEQVTDDTYASLIGELKRWTPAFKKHWTKAELIVFMNQVKDRNDTSLVRYQKYFQRNASAARRNSALRILIEEYKKGRQSAFYAAIQEMLGGYPVCFCAYNNMDSLLPFLYMEDYPDAIRWLSHVLKPYYGEITYESRHKLFAANKAGSTPLCMSNVFHTSTDELICVEYLSCDLSACMRLNAICQLSYDLAHMDFKCIFVVDSYKDADVLLTMMNPAFRRGETSLRHNECYDITFLSLNGDHLFTIAQDGSEVKVRH